VIFADNVRQKTAGVHVTRRFQQLQGQAGVALVTRAAPAFLPAVIARFFALFVSRVF
jgi:hypothetical protein